MVRSFSLSQSSQAGRGTHLTSLYSLVIGLLSEFEITADEFVRVAKGIMFLPEQEPTCEIAASI